VRALKKLSASGLANPFTFVEVNGLRVPEPEAAYAVLWEALYRGEEGQGRMSNKEALKRLGRYFAGGGGGPGGGAWSVLRYLPPYHPF
jgi:origin recognition complex subunit 1